VDRLLLAVAVVIIVPAVLVGYILFMEAIVRRMPGRSGARIRPWLWLAPAFAFLTVFLIYPILATIYRSFFSNNERSQEFVGIDHYTNFFQSADSLLALRNNIIWMVLLTAITVGVGLVIAVLVDRVKYEPVVKTVIFLPMAISFVAAAVIWRFVYAYDADVGLLNAGLGVVGQEPVLWREQPPFNNVALIVVGAWMLTGFSMVILSAGLKGISTELLEAARVDGANELQVFRKIILPLLMPTIAVIATTVIIFALKTFDIVFVMTSGNYETEVIANLMYREMFLQGDNGTASAIAVILLIAVIPVMLFNIRRFREQEAIR
jgi:alpha-glucoside transport system permease protein